MATKAQEVLAKGIKEALANQKKLKGKPRSVGAAVKAGEKFFFDKKGVKKLAVTAATLKKEGKTLREWANDFSKSSKPKSKTKTLRPKERPDTVTRAGMTRLTLGGYGDMSVAEKKEVDAANKAIKLQIKARKDTGPNAARKKRMANSSDNEIKGQDRTDDNSASSNRGKSFGTRVKKRKPGGFDPLGIAGRKTLVSAIDKKQKLKSYTFKQWDAMSEVKRKNLRLPIKTYPGSKKLKVSQRPLK